MALSVPTSSSSSISTTTGGGGGGSGEQLETAVSLTMFLQRASAMLETLMEEDSAAAAAARSSSSSQAGGGAKSLPKSIFAQAGPGGGGAGAGHAAALGTDATAGANELIRLRRASALSFSALQPHFLLSCHPHFRDNDDDERAGDDLKPFAGMLCVWSILAGTGAPAYVLQCPGQPLCASFSRSDTSLVCCGTDAGSLHLFDLRESHGLHQSRDAMDLRIARGIRQPCCNSGSGSGSSTGGEEAVAGTHMAPVVQLEAAASQFVSLDATGKVISESASLFAFVCCLLSAVCCLLSYV